MKSSRFEILSSVDHAAPSPTLMLIGSHAVLGSERALEILPDDIKPAVFLKMLGNVPPKSSPRVTSTWLEGTPTQLIVGVLPTQCSRHNTPSQAWAIPQILRSAGQRKQMTVVALLEDAKHAPAVTAAYARSLKSFAAGSKRKTQHSTLCLLAPEGEINIRPLEALARGVQRCRELVDAPPNVLNPASFVELVKQTVAKVPEVSLRVISGQNLISEGLLGIYSVGKSAQTSPALVVLDYKPDSSETSREVWVGKGITYDSGGLSLKSKTGMPGMKSDMGGAAAVFSAFVAVAHTGRPAPLTAILCIAENGIGPEALRPDDVIEMYSGLHVEINNTDAEGRLVLADGVAWAVDNRSPSRIIDMATLTGAQSMATGKRHGALYCNDDQLEHSAVASGRESGDLVHPLPYCPEFFAKEFASLIADLKNSVKDRQNAQSSCAGEFIRQHLGDYTGPWLHIDMAGPGFVAGRATGWGVAFLMTMAGVL